MLLVHGQIDNTQLANTHLLQAAPAFCETVLQAALQTFERDLILVILPLTMGFCQLVQTDAFVSKLLLHRQYLQPLALLS
jgi:hypothetical protein